MTDRRRRFLLLFALANAGGVVAYVPLLTLVLPAKIALLAGEARVEWLGAASLAGAAAASIGNFAFGWVSDVAGTRRGWAAAGLALTLATYVLLHLATSAVDIVFAVIAYQLALNMLLGPLMAWAADVVPDSDKGLLGGVLAAGPPVGALAGVAVTLPSVSGQISQLALICLVVLVLSAPLLALGGGPRSAPAQAPSGPRATSYVDFGLMWVARLLVQVAGATLFTFLLYYFQSRPVPASPLEVAMLSAGTLLVAFPLTVLLGRVSDRIGPRRPFLIGSVLAAALGLLVMAWQEQLALAMAGYAIFGCAAASFLALHSAFAMQLLPAPGRHGRDLGLLNLTNTLPHLVSPALAIWLVPGRGFGPLLSLLAVLMLVAGLCICFIRGDPAFRRQAAAGDAG